MIEYEQGVDVSRMSWLSYEINVFNNFIYAQKSGAKTEWFFVHIAVF